MARTIGWDLGGANVKAAVVEQARVQRVVQVPCPAINDPTKFDRAVTQALREIGPEGRHAITMTGELSDVFESRRQGVRSLVGLMQQKLGDQQLAVYAGRNGFRAPADAVERPLDVASANWHATASFIAFHDPEALLVDVGTTTTDLIPIAKGEVATVGYKDGERLASGELVYTGVVRTPVMAITHSAPFPEGIQSLAAERFATMADAYRMTGDLPEDADPYPSADGRGKTKELSAARLARMTGYDFEDAEMFEWESLARFLASRQLYLLATAARGITDRDVLTAEAPVVGAGIGRFLARSLAERLGRPYVEFSEFFAVEESAKETACRCAPAVAVALLAETINFDFTQDDIFSEESG